MKKYLTILQLESYDILRFINWLIRNIYTKKTEDKIELVYTTKIKLITLASFVIGLLLTLYLFNLKVNILLSITIVFILYSQSYILIIIGTFLLKPLDYFLKYYEILIIKNKLSNCKNLKIVGITGSYGKTSTKEILYQLIKGKFKTLRTPESFNTIAGIKKTLDYELDSTYEVFICEMSAYKKGDIKNICKIVNPEYGILTGLAKQHLDRFGSFDNIVNTKFELYEAIDNKRNIILNINNLDISNEIKKRNIKESSEYIKARNIVISKSGSEFEITYKNKDYKISTKLFGYSNIENILGALTMALKLGIHLDYLVNQVENLNSIQNRFALKESGSTTIVDNTFSSNEITFKETIKTAEKVRGKKLLITPALVELGTEEELINSTIGKLAYKAFDKIILVGKNKRTIAFSKYFGSKPTYIDDTRKDYFETIESLKDKYDWIFLENDVTQNYN